MCRLFVAPVALFALLVFAPCANAQKGDITEPPARQEPVKPLGAKEIFKRFRASVVLITATGTKAGKEENWLGNGFFYRYDYLVATAFHLLEGAKTLKVADADGTVLQVSDVVFDKANDVALLRLTKATGRTPLDPVSFSDLSVGENIYVIGNPLGLFPDTISPGIVSGKRDYNKTPTVQITAPVSQGNSGGPLITESGKAAGIISWGLDEGQAINMAVSIDVAEKVSKEKPVALDDFLAGKVGGITRPPTGNDSPATLGPEMTAETAGKVANQRWIAVLTSYLTASARYQINETGIFAHNYKNYKELMEADMDVVLGAILQLSQDKQLVAALKALGRTPEQMAEIDDKVGVLYKKWFDFVQARVHQVFTFENSTPEEYSRSKDESNGSYDVLIRSESTVIDLFAKEPWIKANPLDSIPDPVVYQRIIFASLGAQPDLDFPKNCLVTEISWSNKVLRKGDEIIAIGLKKDKEIHSVATWRDVYDWLERFDFKGELTLRIKRTGQLKNLTYTLGQK